MVTIKYRWLTEQTHNNGFHINWPMGYGRETSIINWVIDNAFIHVYPTLALFACRWLTLNSCENLSSVSACKVLTCWIKSSTFTTG